MPELHCSRCLQPVGQLTDGHIDIGVRLVCANCDDKKMSDGINMHMARTGKEQK